MPFIDDFVKILGEGARTAEILEHADEMLDLVAPSDDESGEIAEQEASVIEELHKLGNLLKKG